MNNFIPFEKVSVEEAKAKAQADKESVQIPDVNWQPFRSGKDPARPNIKELMPWIQQLPMAVRPKELIIQFARIANRLAELWSYPKECEKYLNELMIDERGTRQGFPPEVAQELAALHAHFNTHVLPNHRTIWGDLIDE